MSLFFGHVFGHVVLHRFFSGCDCSINADMIYGLICLHAHVCIAVVIETLLLPCATDNLPRRMSEYVQCLIVFPLHSLHPVW